jgi:hypothetical protein
VKNERTGASISTLHTSPVVCMSYFIFWPHWTPPLLKPGFHRTTYRSYLYLRTETDLRYLITPKRWNPQMQRYRDLHSGGSRTSPKMSSSVNTEHHQAICDVTLREYPKVGILRAVTSQAPSHSPCSHGCRFLLLLFDSHLQYVDCNARGFSEV